MEPLHVCTHIFRNDIPLPSVIIRKAVKMTAKVNEISTYLLLTKFTQSGIENVHESPERTEEAKAVIESMGGTWQAFFVMMGRYDGLVIAEFPDDATAAEAILTLASSGNVTTETLRAFTLDEFRDIVEAKV